MKALVLAALLALTPVAAPAATPSLQQETEITASICLAIVTDKVTSTEVIEKLKLDTPQKQREFALHCTLYLQGVKDGIDAASSSAPKGYVS